MPRRSKRQANARGKRTQDANRRQSVGEALGLTPGKPTGASLDENKAIESAMAAARHLNALASGANRPVSGTRAGRRSSIALLDQTGKLFEDDSGDNEGKYDAPMPDLVDREGMGEAEGPHNGLSESGARGDPNEGLDHAHANADLEARPRELAKDAAEDAEENTEDAGEDAENAVDEAVESASYSTHKETAGGAPAGQKGGPLSEIKTPNREPEVPDTEDKRFIKDDAETESPGERSESESEYELTESDDPGEANEKDAGKLQEQYAKRLRREARDLREREERLREQEMQMIHYQMALMKVGAVRGNEDKAFEDRLARAMQASMEETAEPGARKPNPEPAERSSRKSVPKKSKHARRRARERKKIKERKAIKRRKRKAARKARREKRRARKEIP